MSALDRISAFAPPALAALVLAATTWSAACGARRAAVDAVATDGGTTDGGRTDGGTKDDPAPAADARPVEPDAEAAVEARGLASFVEEVGGTTIVFDMVPVEGGRVAIEVEGALRTVDVAPFWIARHETTWDLYDVFVFGFDQPGELTAEGLEAVDGVTRPSRPYIAPDRGYGHRGYAAISMSYEAARHFCRWLSKKTGRRYRLPTEAELRLVCARSGITAEALDAYAWYEDNADFTPHPVGTKERDALGVHDLWGNVREWCVGVDGKPVALGGSFIDPPDEVGCGARAVPDPDWQMTDPQVPKSTWWLSDADFVGFRLVCEPPEAKEGGTHERP